MIISKTPFRVSLAGGGSDLAEYYHHRPGRVVSLALRHYMYVTVNRRFDQSIRVSYTRTEIVDRVEDLQHDLIREALRMTGVVAGVEVTTIADLPAGIGLGSSSALTVGVLNALYAFKGEWRTPAELAARACQIEIDVLGHPIGKQDQYIAAFGGLQEIQFNPDESVRVHPIVCPDTTRDRLQRHLLLFFTGTQRAAGSVLADVRGRMAGSTEARENIDRLVTMADSVKKLLTGSRIPRLGPLLDESWQVKKRMSAGVTTPEVDRLYRRAIRAGADGGKISGAGGGGCLLLVARPATHDRIRASMRRAGLREVPVAIEPEGTRIIHYGD
ncbi:MAG: GHMP kinase [Acidobacteria bacterium]|nr:GHMP kinase [Acidobacteriota bacterium]